MDCGKTTYALILVHKASSEVSRIKLRPNTDFYFKIKLIQGTLDKNGPNIHQK